MRGIRLALTYHWCFAELLSVYLDHTAVRLLVQGCMTARYFPITSIILLVFLLLNAVIYQTLVFIQHQSWQSCLISTDYPNALQSLYWYASEQPFIIEILCQVFHI